MMRKIFSTSDGRTTTIEPTRELDEVYVVYTEMVTSMLLEPRVRKMLPLDADSFVWAPHTR